MERQQETKKARITWEQAFALALVLFILFGLGTKLVLSVTMGLNSDMVGEGLESMEIWKNQNYLLSGYYLPSQDTFIFTELLPFQLIPQILTDYSPLALKIMTFIEFSLGVAVLSYIIYVVSGSYISALLFAALAANLSPGGYQYFALPTSHMGTIVFLGIILALLIYMGKKSGEQVQQTKKGRKTRSTKILWAPLLVLIVLVALTVVSDTIILPWLIIPFIIAYLLLVKEKTNTMNYAIASMAIVAAIVYIFKTYFVYNWVAQDIFTPQAVADMSSTIRLYFQALALLLNQGLYSVSMGLNGFGILEALSLLAFIALVVYAVKNALADRSKRFFYFVMLASGITMFAMWLVSHYTIDISGARYLTFTALTVFMLIALSYRANDKVYSALAIGLLLISAIFCYTQMGMYGQHPNAEEYGLISYLKENNQTFGYSTYWDSNIITYLSGEDVTVRATFFYRNDLSPNVWLACERWYQSTPDRSFILVDNSSTDENARGVVNALTASLNASAPLHYDHYDIYPLDNYHIAPFQVQR